MLQEQDRNQCCPNLDEKRVLAGSDKGLDLQVLLDRLEENLDLPEILIDCRHGCRPEGEMIGQKNNSAVVLLVPSFYTSEAVGQSFWRSTR